MKYEVATLPHFRKHKYSEIYNFFSMRDVFTFKKYVNYRLMNATTMMQRESKKMDFW